jgi:hypothetical protein
MKLATVAACFAILGMVPGCGASRPAPDPRAPICWETRELAPGVELRISREASPGALEAAERLQAEYRSTYLNAR